MKELLRRLVLRVLLAAIVGAIPTPTAAQVRTLLTAGEASSFQNGVMAYDDGRERLVLVLERGVIIERDASTWSIALASLPGTPLAAAYDPVGRRMLFAVSTRSGSRLFAYDGVTVVDLGVVPLLATGLVFDSARNRLVAFGNQPVTAQALLFEWDGLAWAQATVVTQPTPSSFECAAYDLSRGVTVATFFRSSLLGTTRETWEWDGANWVGQNVEINPPNSGPFAYDPNRLQVVTAQAGLRAWNGQTWTQFTAPVPADDAVEVATDLVHGAVWRIGSSPTGPKVARFDGVAWTTVASLMQPGVAFARGRGVFHDLRGSVFLYDEVMQVGAEWRGGRWTELTGTTGPSARDGSAMVYDSTRGEVVLFGGQDFVTSQLLGDTWTWNGTWRLVASSGPSPRSYMGIVDDRGRGRVVMIGAVTPSSGLPLDRWEWDGVAWSQVGSVPPTNVLAVYRPVLGHDEARQRLVFHCEYGTWEETAGQWQSVPSVSHVSRMPSLVWNVARQRLQMVSARNEYIEWDGVTWNTIGMETGDLAYDRHRNVALAVSHFELAQWSDFPVGAFDVGRGCGSVPTPALVPFGMPRIGNADFHVDLRAAGGRQFAALSLGLALGNVPLGGGCALHVQQEIALLVALTNASGFLHQPVPVPDAPALLGLTVMLQGGVLDSGAPLGFALTPGLRLVLGD